MLRDTVNLTKTDKTAYPFLKITSEYMKDPMKNPSLDIEELTSPELEPILLHAQERLEKAIQFVFVGERCNDDCEIPSFPIAVMPALATKNSFIKRRYALAEAKQAYHGFPDKSGQIKSGFINEPRDKLMAIARDFNWDIARNRDSGIPLGFFISLADYLRNHHTLKRRKLETS